MKKKTKASAKAIRKKTYHPPRKKNELINQINSEIRFLTSENMKYLVHEADIGCCHADYLPITRRVNKLKKKLKNFEPIKTRPTARFRIYRPGVKTHKEE